MVRPLWYPSQNLRLSLIEAVLHDPYIPTLTLPSKGEGIFSRAIAFEIPKLAIPAKAGIQGVPRMFRVRSPVGQ